MEDPEQYRAGSGAGSEALLRTPSILGQEENQQERLQATCCREIWDFSLLSAPDRKWLPFSLRSGLGLLNW